jgi:hypothetical protein
MKPLNHPQPLLHLPNSIPHLLVDSNQGKVQIEESAEWVTELIKVESRRNLCISLSIFFFVDM